MDEELIGAAVVCGDLLGFDGLLRTCDRLKWEKFIYYLLFMFMKSCNFDYNRGC